MGRGRDAQARLSFVFCPFPLKPTTLAGLAGRAGGERRCRWLARVRVFRASCVN